MAHSHNADLADLVRCYKNSPEPSFKVSNYFPIYAELFGHLRGTDCTWWKLACSMAAPCSCGESG